jgi:hypothetical protein
MKTTVIFVSALVSVSVSSIRSRDLGFPLETKDKPATKRTMTTKNPFWIYFILLLLVLQFIMDSYQSTLTQKVASIFKYRGSQRLQLSRSDWLAAF